jgi:NAD(P)-dependent dehydrogenase (short-subunit alcohol dehydrogenase family)
MLRGARVAVIGGTSGIGLAVARASAQAGARVVVASRSAERLEAARAAIPGVEAHPLDTTCPDSVGRFFAELGTVDHLVITAADAAMGRLADLDLAEARAFLDSKLWGPYTVVKEAAPRMSRQGSITLFSGAAARRASPGFALGSAINAAVEALAVSLAAELAPVRVNAVSPGIIETPVWQRWAPPEVREQVFGTLVGRLATGRPGTAEEVAALVLFVLSAPYVTGSVLSIDGGYSLL